ncbi:hypothetical protein TCE0_044r16660 [Talaromyces pinophilus]|uniref:Peptidase M12B domain-containing protein n=1 Tax=Talaromyces pinophilus TaxID=128442 RepID=A0A478ECI7_TALPI|nr:hypothetical protein TCE0_044r16660 [Talaromyces pinophilus]
MKISIHLLLVYSLSILNHSVIGHSIQSHAKRHTVRLEEIAIHTLSQSVKGVDQFDLTFKIQGQDSTVRLRLKPNRDIFANDAQIQYLDTRGEEQISHNFEDQERVFKGDIWLYYASKGWQPSGRARVYIVEDGISPLFQGSLTISNRRFHVNIVSGLGGTASSSIPHLEITTSDDSLADLQNLGSWETVNKRHSTYGGDLIFGAPLPLNRMSLLRRHSLEYNEITESTVGYSTSPRVALIGLARDCSYRAAFGSAEEMRRELVSMVNSASEVFERSFNISIGIRNLTINDETCPDTGTQSVPWNVACHSGDLNWRLDQFASWRGLQNDTNAYWTLMTNCPTGNVVGVSLVGELCSRNEGVNVVVRTSNQWQVFAHESGHTFGAIHDCDSQTCSSSPEQCCPLSSSTCDAAVMIRQLSQLQNVATESSRKEKNAIVVKTAGKTPAVMERPASLPRERSVMMQPDPVVSTASLRMQAPCVAQAAGHATSRRPVLATTQAVRLTCTWQMGSPVAIYPAFSVPVANVPAEICSAGTFST